MTNASPIAVEFTEAEKTLAEVFGKDRGMVELVRKCPECQQFILVPDNGVWLDAKPLEPDNPDYNGPLAMGIMNLGGLRMAAGGNIEGGSHHMIHSHQPDEVD